MKLMTKQSEKKLIASVEHVIADVSTGSTPTDALTKIAKAESYRPDEIRVIAQAYNQSKTISVNGEKQGSARTVPFSLANAAATIESVFPAKQSTGAEKIASAILAVTPGIGTNIIDIANTVQRVGPKPQLEKVASDHVNVPMVKIAIKQAEQTIRDSSQDKSYWTEKIAQIKEEVGPAIRRQFPDMPFDNFEEALTVKYGQEAQKLAGWCWEASRAEKFNQKRANLHGFDPSQYTLEDFKGGGWASVESLVNAATNLQKAATQQKEAAEKLAGLQESIAPPEKPDPKPDIWGDLQKKAEGGLFAGTAGALKGLTSLGDTDSSAYDNELDNALSGLSDPNFRDRLRQIQVKSMLHDLMANDEVISGYDSKDVINQFNNIYEVAPEAATRKGVMQDMLRRALVNNGLESMELGQAASLTNNLPGAKLNVGRKALLDEISATPKTVAQPAAATTLNPFTQYGAGE